MALLLSRSYFMHVSFIPNLIVLEICDISTLPNSENVLRLYGDLDYVCIYTNSDRGISLIFYYSLNGPQLGHIHLHELPTFNLLNKKSID